MIPVSLFHVVPSGLYFNFLFEEFGSAPPKTHRLLPLFAIV